MQDAPTLETATPLVSDTPQTISYCGKSARVTNAEINGKRFIIHRGLLRIARLQDEWYEAIGNPDLIIGALKNCNPVPDLFTFWQRLPDVVPAYPYYHEMEALSAVPLQGFRHWWEKQIKSDTRKKAKRAEKRGVIIRLVSLDDNFVQGVVGIYNDTPVRRGKRCWHYGKSFDEVKGELSRDLATSKFIAADEGEELVGFVKLNFAEGRFANPGLILSKIKAREKYVNNALLTKAIQVCTETGVPFLIYTNWRRGTQAEFLMRHGFQKTLVPRYWIPLTKKGQIAIKFGFHHGIRGYIPESVMNVLRELRGVFYRKWYARWVTRQAPTDREEFEATS